MYLPHFTDEILVMVAWVIVPVKAISPHHIGTVLFQTCIWRLARDPVGVRKWLFALHPVPMSLHFYVRSADPVVYTTDLGIWTNESID